MEGMGRGDADVSMEDAGEVVAAAVDGDDAALPFAGSATLGGDDDGTYRPIFATLDDLADETLVFALQEAEAAAADADDGIATSPSGAGERAASSGSGDDGDDAATGACEYVLLNLLLAPEVQCVAASNVNNNAGGYELCNRRRRRCEPRFSMIKAPLCRLVLPQGSELHSLAVTLGRIENLSHMLAWTRADRCTKWSEIADDAAGGAGAAAAEGIGGAHTFEIDGRGPWSSPSGSDSTLA
jgi:hypothetical protein